MDKIYKDKNRCYICKKDLYLRNGLKINYCENFKENLCDVCKDMHYANNPGLWIIFPKVDKMKTVHIIKCKK